MEKLDLKDLTEKIEERPDEEEEEEDVGSPVFIEPLHSNKRRKHGKFAFTVIQETQKPVTPKYNIFGK